MSGSLRNGRRSKTRLSGRSLFELYWASITWKYYNKSTSLVLLLHYFAIPMFELCLAMLTVARISDKTERFKVFEKLEISKYGQSYPRG